MILGLLFFSCESFFMRKCSFSRSRKFCREICGKNFIRESLCPKFHDFFSRNFLPAKVSAPKVYVFGVTKLLYTTKLLKRTCVSRMSTAEIT